MRLSVPAASFGCVSTLDVDPATVARLGDLCLALPEVVEENAWLGVRWRVRGRTFAHVLALFDGRPASYAAAAGFDGPAIILTFRVTPEDAELLGQLGLPHFAARFGRDLGGLVLDGEEDWAEIAELLTDSYCLLAPAKLAARVPRPGPPGPISTPG